MRSIRYDGYSSTFRKLKANLLENKRGSVAESGQVQKSQNELVECAKRLNIPIFKVENYHSDEAIKLLRETDADLGILYGTNIIRESVFTIPRLGSINIHQGLAPMYRGGPTVFWELFNDEKEVGITVHFVAPKVDTGDIILQMTVPLEYDFSRYGLRYEDFLLDFRELLIEPSAQLLAEAVRRIAEGNYQRTKQDTTIGRRYKLPIKSEKDELLRVLIKRQKAFEKTRAPKR
jgi:methionyl-tRNA formyltransferase